MNRNRTTAICVAIAFVAAIAAFTLQRAHSEEPAGLALFKKNGCNECHVISALGVEKEAKKKDDAAAAASESKKKKKDPPDLSGVGLEHDAKWISAYLNKEETNKDGEKHEKRFKGTEADRRTVAMWLASLKTEVKKAPAEEKKGEGGTQGEAQSDSAGGK